MVLSSPLMVHCKAFAAVDPETEKQLSMPDSISVASS
jgi:hypothetical protein